MLVQKVLINDQILYLLLLRGQSKLLHSQYFPLYLSSGFSRLWHSHSPK